MVEISNNPARNKSEMNKTQNQNTSINLVYSVTQRLNENR